jgi:tungstate transport system substrate-binding protein
MPNHCVTPIGTAASRHAVGGALLLTLAAACTSGPGKATPPPIIMATTTSTYDSGLLDEIIPPFEKPSGMTVKTIVVGSGKALALGERGEADLLLVHAPEAEERFMARGGGLLRRRMMYNDFVLVGPAADPAGLRGAADLTAAMTALHRSGAAFVSRGDDSGTNEMELKLWKQAGLSHPEKGYLETGQGMGATLRVASEKRGYTLTDRGTFLSLQSRLFLVVLFEGDPVLRNIYHVIVVDPKRGARVNEPGARALARYLLSDEVLARVRDFGRERFGRALFVPDAEPFDAAPGGLDAPHR